MALLILALLQRIFLMSSLMLLLVWLIFFMVLIKLLPILGTDRKSGSAGMPRPISYAVFCLKKKKTDARAAAQGAAEGPVARHVGRSAGASVACKCGRRLNGMDENQQG